MSVVNNVVISGIVHGGPENSNKYNQTVICPERLSEVRDCIPIILPEDIRSHFIEKKICVKGEFHSFTHNSQLNLFVTPEAIMKTEKYDENQIFLEGYICKMPVYRKTPLGREITDILLAVNRPYGKSDYIPCICWGRNARFASGLTMGTRIQIWGRIQSREYTKKVINDQRERRVAYEVSINRLEIVE